MLITKLSVWSIKGGSTVGTKEISSPYLISKGTPMYVSGCAFLGSTIFVQEMPLLFS